MPKDTKEKKSRSKDKKDKDRSSKEKKKEKSSRKKHSHKTRKDTGNDKRSKPGGELRVLIGSSELDYGKKIAEGAYGSVYVGKCRGAKVAIKKLKGNPNPEKLATFKEEIKVMSKLTHPNIVLFMGACIEEDGAEIALVTEFISGGDLHALLRDKSATLTTAKKLSLARDVALGMQWLHGSDPPVVHRDLKPTNLMIDENGRVKICDFGLSVVERPIGEPGTVPKGSPLYMAPEMMVRDPAITTRCDIYSYGLILWEIMTRLPPFQKYIEKGDIAEFAAAVKRGVRPSLKELPEDAPKSLRSLIKSCWNKDPSVRPTFGEIYNMIGNILVEYHIQDPDGRAFWNESFPTQESVEWGKFISKLVSEVPICPPDKPITASQQECLRAVLGRTGNGTSRCVVTTENFGVFCSFFGPLTAEAAGGKYLVPRLVKLLKLPWFHGSISRVDSETLLHESAEGTYLVRFSSTQRGTFSISYVSGDLIMHQRVQYSPESGFQSMMKDPESAKVVIYRSKPGQPLSHFIKKLGPSLGLRRACPGSQYRRLFEMGGHKVASLDGYALNANVQSVLRTMDVSESSSESSYE